MATWVKMLFYNRYYILSWHKVIPHHDFLGNPVIVKKGHYDFSILKFGESDIRPEVQDIRTVDKAADWFIVYIQTASFKVKLDQLSYWTYRIPTSCHRECLHSPLKSW